ncbi:hypothetical protein PGQ11_009084 [Apiospora arundinis]|uniref:Uncharacterized protein n=1 Tax=Apiospora arundinis TaxID=335852 RepID=A0ABR2IH67_9PEZI
MPGIDNGLASSFTHESSRYHEVPQVNDVDESGPCPVRPPRQHQSSSLTSSYSESTFACQSTGHGSSYGQDNLKEAEPRTEATPKRVLRTGWLRFIQSWLVHTPAVLSTVAIVYIGSTQQFWFPEQGPSFIGGIQASPSTIINLLQVAAKIHEIMMVLSLSAIMLAIYRRRLIGDGVRLGFLTAGYRVGDLKYLLSSSFWSQGSNKPWEILLCGFLVFATVMSATVGPASAVLLTPSLDWFEFTRDTAFSNMGSPLTYNYKRGRVWRRLLMANSTDAAKPALCRTPWGLYAADCPAKGFREMNQWAKEWRATNLTTPILFHAIASDIGRRLETKIDEQQLVALSTTPSEFLLNSIGLFQNFIAAVDIGAVSGSPWLGKLRYRLNTTGSAVQANTPSEELFQPQVQSKCQIYEYSAYMSNTKIHYPTEGLDCMGDNECERRCASPHRIQQKITKYFVVADNSSVVYLSGQIGHWSDGDHRQENKVYLCSLVASWMPANYTFDPVKSNVLNSTLWSDQDIENTGRNKSTAGIVVKFTNSWLELLNPWIDKKERQVQWTALDALTNHFKDMVNDPEDSVEEKYNKAAKEISLAKVVGVYLTEALARTSSLGDTLVKLKKDDKTISYAKLDFQRHEYLQNITVINKTHLEDKITGKVFRGNLEAYDKAYSERALPIALVAERYGYGTGQPRKTLHFAQAMLAIYLGAVCLYAAAMAAGHGLELYRGARGRRVLSVVAWSDLQDLLLLALKTPAPRDGGPDGVGAGAKSNDVWKKVVRVRADDRNHVQIVMDDGEA